MKAIFSLIAIIFTVFIDFSKEEPKKNLWITAISDNKKSAAVPRLTFNHQQKPVLSWTEKEGDNTAFYFAVSEDGGQTFGKKITVPTPERFSVHAEGMPKVAFKADGTVIVLMEAKRNYPNSKFGSYIYYGMSKDGGKTWDALTTIHRDTVSRSHSFGDLITLPNGEVGASWLDEKLEGEGRCVKFAQTSAGKGFGDALIVDRNACQCCRTNLFIDKDKRIHLTFRDLAEDGVRDMAHVTSADGGLTFSSAQVVFPDKWKANLCPHTGPATAQVGNQLYMAWYCGKENNEGVRVAQLGNKALELKLSKTTHHPQLAHSKGELALVWEEYVELADGEPYRKIGLKTWKPQQKANTRYLSETHLMASYPCLLPTTKGLLVAYELKKGEEPTQVVYQLVKE